jgi:hypothetical protein
MTWTEPKTWADGDPLSAQVLNTQLRDNLASAGQVNYYLPRWKTLGAPQAVYTEGDLTLGSGDLTGWYTLQGDLVRWGARLEWGGSTSIGGTGIWSLSRPFESRAVSGVSNGGAPSNWTDSKWDRIETGATSVMVTRTGYTKPYPFWAVSWGQVAGTSGAYAGLTGEISGTGWGEAWDSSMVLMLHPNITNTGFDWVRSGNLPDYGALMSLAPGDVFTWSGWYFRTGDILLEEE